MVVTFSAVFLDLEQISSLHCSLRVKETCAVRPFSSSCKYTVLTLFCPPCVQLQDQLKPCRSNLPSPYRWLLFSPALFPAANVVSTKLFRTQRLLLSFLSHSVVKVGAGAPRGEDGWRLSTNGHRFPPVLWPYLLCCYRLLLTAYLPHQRYLSYATRPERRSGRGRHC